MSLAMPRAIGKRITSPRFSDPALAFHWPAAIAFAALCFAVSYPGRLNQDSLYAVITMTARGELGNWHSPTLGWLWSLPGGLLGQPAGALLVQSLLLGLFAGFLPRVPPTPRGRLTLALELLLRVVLAGSFGSIGKDVATLGALLILVQLLRHALHTRLSYVPAAALAILVMLVLLIKSPNFLTFVLGIALLLPFFLHSFRLYATIVTTTLLLGALAVPLNRAVDAHLFGAKDMHPDKQLVIFDLAAISLRTGANAFAKVPGWPTAQLPPVASCFLPNMWDPFAPWGPCSGYSAAYDRLDAPLKRRWALEILTHPLAYAGHRLSYAGYLVRSQDHASWGIAGDAVNDAASATALAERREMMARLHANRPVQLWRAGPATAAFQWLEVHLLRYPKIQSVALVGSLAILLFGWLRRRTDVRLGALLPAAIGLGNFGMLLVFGVADPARYLLPTVCLFYVALLAQLAPGYERKGV
ncbi:hypothetical protein [Sphingomonas alpina]|nr:hypothetical protein [Sphingomonas alpina]